MKTFVYSRVREVPWVITSYFFIGLDIQIAINQRYINRPIHRNPDCEVPLLISPKAPLDWKNSTSVEDLDKKASKQE